MAGAAGSVRWTTCKWFAGAWLLTLAGVFCAFASRGFEYTDESFYLLSLVWWREITSSFTLFGVVLGGLFDAVGQDITTFRILGMLALLGSSAYMAVMAFRLVSQAHAGLSALRGLVTIVVMGAALQYYDVFSVLRVPSYNLLALCALMIATGVMLDMLTRHRAGRSPVGQAVVYGVMLGLCAAGKVSTALLGALLHLVFFVASLRAPRSLAAVKAVLGALFGLALVAAVVAALQPDAIAVMRLGLTISATTDERYGLANLVNLIRWDVQRQAVDHGYVLVGLLVLGVALRRLPPTDARHLHRAILWVGLIVCVVTQVLPSLSHLWLLAALLCVLWICLPVGRSVAVAPGQSGLPPQDLRLLMLLLGLPLAFSFGTNGRVLEHSEAAAAPAMLAICLSIAVLWHRGLMGRASVAACLLMLLVPASVAQVRLATDLSANYRQRAPLARQGAEVQVGLAGSHLLVDRETQDAIHKLQRLAAQSGFKPGTAIQDFTGDGGGAVFILGGRPLATAWMGGGYRGSEVAAEKLLAATDKQALERAWLLSSANNPRAIKDWQKLLKRRLGADRHELVATVELRAPYDWEPDAPGVWNITLWRPTSRE